MVIRTPLFDLQKSMVAAMNEMLGWELPYAYSTTLEEYEAATQGVGLVDRSYVGRLRATGKDALDLLNRLSTNTMEDLPLGTGVGTILTNNKGRILDVLVVAQMEDHLLLLTSPQNRQKVMDWIDLYTFLEEVSIKDVTADTAMVSLMGPKASALLGELTKIDLSRLEMFASVKVAVKDVELSIVRTDAVGVPGYDLIVSASQAGVLWKTLIEEGMELGIKPVGMEALEIVRVERGIPLYSRELSERFNPLEANLLDYVSFTKGCYIGQEVVARLNTYKKVQKHLMGLILDSEAVPPLNAKLLVDGQEVGFITSSARSILIDKPIALGYVKKAYAKDGVMVVADWDSGESVARVVSLPFAEAYAAVSS